MLEIGGKNKHIAVIVKQKLLYFGHISKRKRENLGRNWYVWLSRGKEKQRQAETQMDRCNCNNSYKGVNIQLLYNSLKSKVKEEYSGMSRIRTTTTTHRGCRFSMWKCPES